MKKRILLAGLLLSFSTATLRAQSQAITSYLPDDGRDYRGYCIDRVEFDQGRGYLTAGSRSEKGNNTTVHVMGMLAGSASTAHSQILVLPGDYEDVRAIGITIFQRNQAALLLQTRQKGYKPRVTVALLDCHDLNNLQVNRVVELEAGLLRYPTSICVSPDESVLYVAGYELDGNTPEFSSAKRGFVTALNASNLDVRDSRRYDSPQAPNGNKDYDMIQRVRFIKDRLYVIGSVNGVEAQYQSSTSRAWVAELNPDDLHIVNDKTYGNEAWARTGVQGVDLAEDVKNPGEFYLVGNEYYMHSWFVSKLKSNLFIYSGGNGFNNTLWYAPSADIKSSGVLAQADGRVSLYGTMRYGVNGGGAVASFNDGAVPFVMGFYPTLDPNTGFGFSNLTWFNEGNLPSTVTNLRAINSPYWINAPSTLTYWSIPAFATLADPTQQQSDLAMMGHVGYDGSYPDYLLAPRLIESDAKGNVDGCKGSVDVTDQVERGIEAKLLLNDNIVVSESGDELKPKGLENEFPERGFKPVACFDKGEQYYRQAAVTAATGTLTLQSLAPNPATDAVTLRWSGSLAADAALRLELTDLFGRKLGTAALRSHDASTGVFALPQLAPGLYMASLYVDGVLAGQQKLSIR